MIRGVPREQVNKIAEERLKKLRLWRRKDDRAGSFSGGMRRRLSMVLSTIGDPKLLILDEVCPFGLNDANEKVTTGLDPIGTCCVVRMN